MLLGCFLYFSIQSHGRNEYHHCCRPCGIGHLAGALGFAAANRGSLQICVQRRSALVEAFASMAFWATSCEEKRELKSSGNCDELNKPFLFFWVVAITLVCGCLWWIYHDISIVRWDYEPTNITEGHHIEQIIMCK